VSQSVVNLGFSKDILPYGKGRASGDLPGSVNFTAQLVYLVTGISPEVPK
jgi:hypothetical protein